MEENEEVRTVDYLFVLPENVTADPNLRALYEVLVAGYLREVQHLPLTRMAYVLIERIVFYYITMRERERAGTGYGGPVAEKAFKQNWLSLIQEFNKMVAASDQKKNQKMLETVSNIVVGVLADVKDESLREKLVVRIASAFEEAGIS